MRRRLQESFHLSPSNGALIGSAVGNGGGTCVSGLFGVGSAVTNSIPTISVSVQTEPAMLSASGLMTNGAATVLANGSAYATVSKESQVGELNIY